MKITDPETTSLLLDIIKRLTGVGLSYAVSRSLAFNLYTKPRPVKSIAVHVQIGKKTMGDLIELFSPDFFIKDAGIESEDVVEDRITMYDNRLIIRCDLIVHKKSKNADRIFDRRVPVPFRTEQIFFISLEELIVEYLSLAKMYNIDRYRDDVLWLLIENRTTLDGAYLTRRLSELHLITELKTIM
ncbi:MAG: hypothetical protein V1799_18010 [bacterium]